ncbi:pilus assembly protein PilW [Pseudoduganella sp. FT93W]|uniref:Pilus assembly protein PilW n=1 Tax=Duganella fentianensis TaxID=2692177 RepID=A0A845HVI5_9BURK|nr:PilW family protein [Duganella fentianensis]MYN45023.1 pilus assembly protein PilW [Duganella fentianensis]
MLYYGRTPRRSSGRTLVEFLLALGLTALLALLATGLLLVAAQSYHQHSDQQDLNDGAQQALALIAQAIRQAAYVEWDSSAAPVGWADDGAAAVSGLDGRSLLPDGDGIATPLPGVAHGSDVLALRYAGSGSGATGDGSSVNCAGFGVAAPATPAAQGWSIFYVATDTSGVAELRCKYRSAAGWGSDALVRGVESFQVLYGVDTDVPADGIPNAYFSASAVDGLDAALELEGTDAAQRQADLRRKTYWKRVASIRVALLLRSALATRADTGSRQFDLFGADYADGHGEDEGVRIDERRLPQAQRRLSRVMLGATIALRNTRG